jgi:DNA-binding transcriptional regulator YiaG
MPHFNSEFEFNPLSVRNIRQSLGQTQEEFARTLGSSFNSVRNWEQNQTSPAGQFVEGMIRICRERNIDIPNFYSRSA